MQKVKTSQKLTESGLMIALATILSLLKVIELPAGGSVTLASMLPVVIIAYRYGTAWGLLTGLAHGLIQFILGSSVLAWVTGWKAVVAVIALDYILAFAVVGLAGIFRKMRSQPAAMLLGSAFTCLLRYVMHVISGCTVWAGLSIPDSQALLYSVSYNSTYMIPETVILCVAAFYLASSIDFNSARLTTLHTEKNTSPLSKLFSALGGLSLVAAAVVDVVLIFPHLQAEGGEFDITGISNAPFGTVGIVTGICLVAAAAFFVAKRLVSRSKNESAE